MENPSKYVRKALFDIINPEYPCFDSQVTGSNTEPLYVILSTQDKEIDKATKCGNRWISYTLIDIVNIYNGAGNVGSRLANDNAENTILGLIENIEVEGYKVVNRRFEFPSTINTSTKTQTVYRNFIRVVLTLE